MKKIKIPWAKPELGEEELNEVIDSFKSNWLTMGPKVNKLEHEVSIFLEVPYAIAISNGTVALDLVLKAIGVEPGDEVIVPAMTYFATASSVSYQNAVPVFVDIEKETFNLDPDRIPEAITEKTKAIIFIDYGGNPSNYDAIAKVGQKYNIKVLQDGAQSLGAFYKGRPMGAQTETSTMSFHAAKVMTTIEGGMIFTHNESLKEDILSRRNQGESKGGKYIHITLGTNARMTDLTAGIVSYVLREKYGIDTRIAYPMPLYKQEVFASGKLKYRKMECPIAEEVTSKILNLPIFPSMTDDMIEQVCRAIFKEIEK